MSTAARTALSPRSAAVAELFDALEGLMVAYHALPESERAQQWSADADRITGDVARHLSAARTRISSTFDPSTSTPT